MSFMSRQLALEQWLTQTCQRTILEMNPIPGDASMRNYFRVRDAQGTYIAMDAPPAFENCVPFVAIADALRQHGLRTPVILHSDLQQGFLLITDFGEKLLLHTLNATNADGLYQCALDSLAILQTCQTVAGWDIPTFSVSFMQEELNLFKEWFLQKYLNLALSESEIKMLDVTFELLLKEIDRIPKVFIHRDYHSANLMVMPDNHIGLLDFQDAFFGPVTYDLVSLLRDCYIAWPHSQVEKWVASYHTRLSGFSADSACFMKWFDITGLQRHMKALMIFARKWLRDGNKNYLKHMPRTLQYIVDVTAQYPEYQSLNHFFNDVAMQHREKLCVE